MTEQIPLRETARLITQTVNEAVSTAETIREMGFHVQLAPEQRTDREPLVCVIRPPETNGGCHELHGSVRACCDGPSAVVTVQIELEYRSRMELVLAAETRYRADRDFPELLIFFHRRHPAALRRYLELPEVPDEKQVFNRVLRDVYPGITLGENDGERFLALTNRMLQLLRGPVQELVNALRD